MNEETKKCPYCGMEILAVAKKCRFCGEWLGSSVQEEVFYANNSNTGSDKPVSLKERPVKPIYNRFKRMFKFFMWVAIVVSFGKVLLACLGPNGTNAVGLWTLLLMPWNVLPGWFTTLVEGFAFCTLFWALKKYNKTRPILQQSFLLEFVFWSIIFVYSVQLISYVVGRVFSDYYDTGVGFSMTMMLFVYLPLYIMMMFLGNSILKWRRYKENNTDTKHIRDFGRIFIVYGALHCVLSIVVRVLGWRIDCLEDQLWYYTWNYDTIDNLRRCIAVSDAFRYALVAMLFYGAYRFFNMQIMLKKDSVQDE